MLKNDFYNKDGKRCGGMAISNSENQTADMYLYGDIIDEVWERWSDDEEAKAPKDVLDMLNKINDSGTLNVYINSGGGSVFAGISIYNILKRHKGSINVYIDGIAASIASVIAMAGDTITMNEGSTLMIHKPWTIIAGNSNELRKMADTLDILQTNIVDIYNTKRKEDFSQDKLEELVNNETYLTADSAQEVFDIQVSSDKNKVLNKLKDSLKAAEVTEKVTEVTEVTEVTNELTDMEKLLMGVG